MTSIIACVQMTSSADVAANLLQASELIANAAAKNAKLIILPENFCFMGLNPHDKVNHKEEMGQGLIQDFLRREAMKHRVWLVGGTIPISVPHAPEKVYAACLLYNDQGECVARYDKIHLFDVYVESSKESHAESNTIQAGKDVVVVATPFGKVGLCVCYDLRFPELFRQMMQQGAEMIAIPTAFTDVTGEAHWEVLSRARAIENQVYLAASCQTGAHDNGRKTFGNSMIVNPWGVVQARLRQGVGVITAEIDLEYLHKLRNEFPVLKHI